MLKGVSTFGPQVSTFDDDPMMMSHYHSSLMPSPVRPHARGRFTRPSAWKPRIDGVAHGQCAASTLKTCIDRAIWPIHPCQRARWRYGLHANPAERTGATHRGGFAASLLISMISSQVRRRFAAGKITRAKHRAGSQQAVGYRRDKQQCPSPTAPSCE